MYETKFEDGSEITYYLATAYAEGFCEGEDASPIDKLKAWSYLIGTGLCYKLQGSFGREAVNIINAGLINDKGIVNWEYVDEIMT